MESLREMFKAGSGPSSSHTIAPQRAMLLYREKFTNVTSFIVELYGSLSLTGKGHFTDLAIQKSVAPLPCEVHFKLDWDYDFPNGLLIKGFDGEKPLKEWVVYSIGGGSIKVLDENFSFQKQIYPHRSLTEFKKEAIQRRMGYHDLVYAYEPDIKDYLKEMLDIMCSTVARGLNSEGYLLGPLNMPRISKELYENALEHKEVGQNQQKLLAYAYATMEENACLGQVVTAPTCGSSGVLAAIMYHYRYDLKISEETCINALAVAGIFGNVVKTFATVSGAEGGCQAEVGAGCAMAAAAVAFMKHGNLDQIEYAAEIAMEHHLGLTCDPVGGYVIIPCIERNAAASLRAQDAAMMALSISRVKKNVVAFDQVVATMRYTGQRLPIELRETSLGGLATEIKIDEDHVHYKHRC